MYNDTIRCTVFNYISKCLGHIYDFQVLDGKPLYLEMGGNLIPVTKSGEALSMNFHSFHENRLSLVVRIRDINESAAGRVALFSDSRVARRDFTPTPICNLNIVLPDYDAESGIEAEADELKLKHSKGIHWFGNVFFTVKLKYKFR